MCVCVCVCVSGEYTGWCVACGVWWLVHWRDDSAVLEGDLAKLERREEVWQVARCAALGGRSWVLRGVAFPLRSAEGRQFGCLVAGLLSALHAVVLLVEA